MTSRKRKQSEMEIENLLTRKMELRVHGAEYFFSPLKSANDLMNSFHGKNHCPTMRNESTVS